MKSIKAKKIVAIASGALILGSALAGATLDVGQYPAPFIKDGLLNNTVIAVGDQAATKDVIGAVNIGVNLQAEATSPYGITEETVVSEGAVQIARGSNQLELGEPLGDVVSVLTDSDLELLKDGEVRSNAGDGEYTQKLKFGNSALTVKYVKDDSDDLDTHLYVGSGKEIYTYELFFNEPLKSDLDDNDLEDLENRDIKILGTTFTIAEGTFISDDVKLTLLGGQFTDTMEEGEEKTITINGKGYGVKVNLITDSAPFKVKFTVNGEVTDALEEGDTYTLDDEDNTQIGVREILPNEAGEVTKDIVTFYLGANKIILKNGDELKINGNSLDESEVTISTTGTDPLSINSITIKVAADDDLYLIKGEKLSTKLEYGAFITDEWDIVYDGFDDEETTSVGLDPNSDDEYVLEFTNTNSDDIRLPLVYNDGTNLLLGKEDGKKLVLNETIIIEDEYYFLVSDSDETRAFQLKSTDDSNNKVELRDLATGDNFDSYETSGILNKWDFVVSGSNITVDMDNDGDYNGGKATITTEYDGVLEIIEDGNNYNITLTTDEDKIDGSDVDETITFTIIPDGSEVDIGTITGITLLSDEDSDTTKGYTQYGVFVEKDDSDPNEITIDYPRNQLEPLVYVTTTGDATTIETTTGGVTINKIDHSIAKLASEVTTPTNYNLILVGGPCANALVEPLTGLECGDDWPYEPGQALVKLYENGEKVAMLVAGTDALDTRNAADAVARGKFTGTEMLVTSTGLYTYTVQNT